MTPAELCERVVERLETTGWTQGEFGLKEGPNCLWGAVMHESNPMSMERPAVHEALVAYVGGGSTPIAHWNDQPDRTVYEVIDAVKTVGKMFANGEITMDPAHV